MHGALIPGAGLLIVVAAEVIATMLSVRGLFALYLSNISL